MQMVQVFRFLLLFSFYAGAAAFVTTNVMFLKEFEFFIYDEKLQRNSKYLIDAN